MICKHVRQQLSAYLDDELSQERRLAVEAHLNECAHCAREYEQLRTMARAFRDLRFPEPEDMWKEIESRIGAPRPTWSGAVLIDWFRPVWRPLAVAALLLVGIFGYLWISPPAEEAALDYYLQAYTDFAGSSALTLDSSVAYVLSESNTDMANYWEGETGFLLEEYLQDN